MNDVQIVHTYNRTVRDLNNRGFDVEINEWLTPQFKVRGRSENGFNPEATIYQCASVEALEAFADGYGMRMFHTQNFDKQCKIGIE